MMTNGSSVRQSYTGMPPPTASIRPKDLFSSGDSNMSSGLVRFCAKAILWGATAGASFYVLQQNDRLVRQRQQQQPQQVFDQEKEDEKRHHPRSNIRKISSSSSSIHSWCDPSSILAILVDRVWKKTVEPKLPLLVWMSLFATLLDQRASLRPQRWLLCSLLLQLVASTTRSNIENEDTGGDSASKPKQASGSTSIGGFIREKHDSDISSDIQRLHHQGAFPQQTERQQHHHDLGSSAAAAMTEPSKNPTTTLASKRYVELLVHNVSHTDLILSLEVEKQQRDMPHSFVLVEDSQSTSTNESKRVVVAASSPSSASAPPKRLSVKRTSISAMEDDPFCLVRPRFSCFEKYSRVVWENIRTLRKDDKDDANEEEEDDDDDNGILYFKRYSRNEESHRILPHCTLQETATGLRLSTKRAEKNELPLVDLNEVRVRGRDQEKTVVSVDGGGWCDCSCRIRHVLFPLLATLLPRWKESIEDKKYDDASTVKRVLILVSGVGTPRNWTHDRMGNSTETCAIIMKAFLEKIDPTLKVVHIHSQTNIFRYDENLAFVEQELMPTIHAYRDAHARGLDYPDEVDQLVQQQKQPRDVSLRTHPFSADWRDSFHITLSFADGSPARTYAIQASLRQYRPTYFHFWQLKSFWHENKIVNDDIEVHSFEAMETIPPVDINSCTDSYVARVIQEMKSFKEEMVQTLRSDNDIFRFWLRKTHKPVLAVLLVHNDSSDEEPVLYRGTNMEVSMPTGSLCAERNVIGTALADRPGLKREDLKLIAVLAVPPLVLPETMVQTKHEKELAGALRRVQSCHAFIGQKTQPIDPKVTAAESTRKNSVGSDEEWILPFSRPGAESAPSNDDSSAAYTKSHTPVRRIALISKSMASYTTTSNKRTVVLQNASRDLNPLRPCGACNEWLKKIAECNPYFKILTFTDAECNGVYITPCQE